MSVAVTVIFQKKAEKIISRLIELERELSDENKQKLQDIIRMIREDFDILK